MAVSLSFINMKGGVGKSTLAMQLAHSASRPGRRVLAIDLDPQSNLSQAILGAYDYVEFLKKDKPSVVNIFEGYIPAGAASTSPKKLKIKDTILSGVGYWTGNRLDLIPSRLELSRVLRNPAGKERRLAKAIAQVEKDYDLIIIDCAPTESVLTEAAYFASRYVVVPIKPEYMATIGLPLLARSLEEFRLENEDHAIDIAGLVFVHSSSYSSGPEGRKSIADVRRVAKEQKWPVLETAISYSASYAKAAREGAPISRTSYARGKAINEVDALASEILASIGAK